MKALVLQGKQDLKYQEIAKPKISDKEVLINVKASGICGSDMPRVLGSGAHYYPIVLGHEFAGEVVEIGADVTRVAIGDRVACAPLVPCHQCEDCQQGNYSQCKHYSFIGSREFGSWAEYVKVPEKNTVKLPDDVSYLQGAFYEPTTVGLHGLFLMGFQGGTDIAIVGMGTIGLLTMQAAKALGARRVIVFDIDQAKLDIAKEYGADICINTGDENLRDLIAEVSNGRGFPLVVETAGVEFTEILSLEIAANKGSVMYIGTPSKNISIAPREFEYMNRKELTIRGSWMSYSAPFPGNEWELAGYYLSNGSIKIDKLIDRIIPMSDGTQAFEAIEQGQVSGKVIFTNGGEV